MVAGSGQLVNALLEYGLVDQIDLMVFPVVLGSGRKLFKEIENQAIFQLDEVKQVGKDLVVILICRSN